MQRRRSLHNRVLSCPLLLLIGSHLPRNLAVDGHSEKSAAGNTGGNDGRLPSLLWMAPVLTGGGYSSEALSYALALQEKYKGQSKARFGLRQFAEQQSREFIDGLPKAVMEAMQSLFQTGQSGGFDVAVCHATPDVWHSDGAFGWGSVQPCPPRGSAFNIGRTMYETDRLPASWVARLNKMDEVWVPTDFAVEQFASSGVQRDKLVVLPEAVDTELFDPDKHKPLKLSYPLLGGSPGDGDGGVAGDKSLFRFLSVFKWERRKGWDVLLTAYFEEFSAQDPVVLYIKTTAFHSDSEFEAKVKTFTEKLGDSARQPLARHAVIGEDLPLRKLPRLYRAADAFVLPSRGEGWGRPHVEAMSMGLPVIATNWSGPTEFMNETCSLPLRIDGLVGGGEGIPEGHLWAQPSVKHLRELMRWAVEHRDVARHLGLRARELMVKRFAPAVIAEQHLLPHLRRVAQLSSVSKRKRRRGDGEL